MLPDLSSHLHTEECNFLIRLLKECQRTLPLHKRMMRGCGYWYEAVWQCCHEERKWRRETNPKYKKRLVELRRLPEDRYTPALKNLRREGLLVLSENRRGGGEIGGGCSI